MKLLFDQNISFRIIAQLQSVFPNSKQVRALKLENTSDIDIWKYAKKNHYTIVTFDSDFADIASMYNSPPKVIWLRTGNMTTKNIVSLLKKHQDIINKFIVSSEFKNITCLEIE